MPSRATLVVVPPPLLRQWEAEVKKCLNESSLALVVYGGKGGGKPDMARGAASDRDKAAEILAAAKAALGL